MRSNTQEVLQVSGYTPTYFDTIDIFNTKGNAADFGDLSVS